MYQYWSLFGKRCINKCDNGEKTPRRQSTDVYRTFCGQHNLADHCFWHKFTPNFRTLKHQITFSLLTTMTDSPHSDRPRNMCSAGCMERITHHQTPPPGRHPGRSAYSPRQRGAATHKHCTRIAPRHQKKAGARRLEAAPPRPPPPPPTPAQPGPDDRPGRWRGGGRRVAGRSAGGHQKGHQPM
jgi:hypothetical protein